MLVDLEGNAMFDWDVLIHVLVLRAGPKLLVGGWKKNEFYVEPRDAKLASLKSRLKKKKRAETRIEFWLYTSHPVSCLS